MYIFVFAIWVVCAFGCYWLAENSGHDHTLAAVLGFFFGIFAIIVYAILYAKDKDSVPSTTTGISSFGVSGQKRACTNCGTLVANGLAFCPTCGMQIPYYPPPQAYYAQTMTQVQQPAPFYPGLIPNAQPGVGEAGGPPLNAAGVAEPAAVPTLSGGTKMATVTRDLRMGDKLVFSHGEVVVIESIDPSHANEENKYVVFSKELNKRFRLSDNDLTID